MLCEMTTGVYIWATAAGAVLATMVGVLILKVGPWMIRQSLEDIVKRAVHDAIKDELKPLRGRVLTLERTVARLSSNGEEAPIEG